MTKLYAFLLLIALTILVNCAKQRPPSGGPIDNTPPEIVSVFPSPNSTFVETNTKIIIEFSERVDRKSVEGAIFISPYQKDELHYKWRGKKLSIEFPDTLYKNRTYICTIGTNTTDFHRNKMKDSFHLAFSTGEKLDQGRIAGTVFGKFDVEGTIVGAYLLKNEQNPDPSQQFAEYSTQCNSMGAYQLSYLAPATYRLFAISDKNGNKKYDPGYDGISIATTDLTITQDLLSVNNINFQLSVKDTLLPSLKSVIDIDQNHVDVRFDGPIADTKDGHPFIITAEATPNDTLVILNFYQNSQDASRFHLKTENQMPSLSYILYVRDIFDLSGNPIDSNYNSYSFKGNSNPDTLKPKLIHQTINPNAKDVPLDSEIQLIFSEALSCTTLEQHFSLTDSNKNNVAGNYFWQNPANFLFIPNENLISEMNYRVYVAIDSVFDEFGNTLADSAIDFKFSTLKKDTLSSISGMLKDELIEARGKIYLTATQAGKSGIAYHTVLDTVGMYTFENIFPGVYLLYGFRDTDSNGVYSFGQITPFIPAERFLFYPDSIKVRSRWPNDGNDLVFKTY